MARPIWSDPEVLGWIRSITHEQWEDMQAWHSHGGTESTRPPGLDMTANRMWRIFTALQALRTAGAYWAPEIKRENFARVLGVPESSAAVDAVLTVTREVRS